MNLKSNNSFITLNPGFILFTIIICFASIDVQSQTYNNPQLVKKMTGRSLDYNKIKKLSIKSEKKYYFTELSGFIICS